VLRDRDTDSNGTLDERLYSLQDANWNTTALVSTSGTIQERYTYTPFGQVTFRDGSGSTLSNSAKDWVFLHQGGERIAAGDYEFRNRVYSPSLGRWLSNDPLGFEAGDQNWYRAIGNNPGNKNDPSGLIDAPYQPKDDGSAPENPRIGGNGVRRPPRLVTPEYDYWGIVGEGLTVFGEGLYSITISPVKRTGQAIKDFWYSSDPTYEQGNPFLYDYFHNEASLAWTVANLTADATIVYCYVRPLVTGAYGVATGTLNRPKPLSNPASGNHRPSTGIAGKPQVGHGPPRPLGEVPPEIKGFPAEKSWANPNTLEDHFIRHGNDFGAISADDYAQKASQFLLDSQRLRLPTKIDLKGTIRVYDPKTNTFGSYNPNGTTKTFYKPNPAQHGRPTNLDYWNDQPGVLPWTP